MCQSFVLLNKFWTTTVFSKNYKDRISNSQWRWHLSILKLNLIDFNLFWTTKRQPCSALRHYEFCCFPRNYTPLHTIADDLCTSSTVYRSIHYGPPRKLYQFNGLCHLMEKEGRIENRVQSTAPRQIRASNIRREDGWPQLLPLSTKWNVSTK